MHPGEARRRRMMALHNAELTGRECARSGGTMKDNPYLGKGKVRGAKVGLYRAWVEGFEVAQKEMAKERNHENEPPQH